MFKNKKIFFKPLEKVTIWYGGGKYSNYILLPLLILIVFSCQQTGTWNQKADMPTARLGHASCVVDGTIYVIGGYFAANEPGLTTVEMYNPKTDSWTTKTPMPTGRRQLAVSVANGKIYAIGGYTNFRQPGLSTVEEYIPIL